jgi:hypothetical protein
MACAILPVMMTQGWIQQVRARGLEDVFGTALDVLEPFGPLGAQALWIAQPVLGLFVARDLLGDLAQALEEPGGVERLRQQLEEHTPDPLPIHGEGEAETGFQKELGIE